MRLWRVFPDAGSRPEDEGGALWFPRPYQGDGRHDNPELYGALYLAEDAVAGAVETLARFRGTGPLEPALLRRGGLPLALAEVHLDDAVAVIDLDNPGTLLEEGLRPSLVATRHRNLTQAQAATLFLGHPAAGALAWWSTFEATWGQVTIFDRAAGQLRLVGASQLHTTTPVVLEAAELLGLV